jgi:hypothetical protein
MTMPGDLSGALIEIASDLREKRVTDGIDRGGNCRARARW